MAQFAVPCSVYRGGTSRGLFFLEKDLPKNETERNWIFLSGIDGYNASQVNGLGGTTSSTSKTCVVAPSEREDADVDWTFYQLNIAKPVVDSKGTCGNLMAAVGAFSVDQGLVKVTPGDAFAIVRVFNVNIGKVIRMEVPLDASGRARADGGFAIPGVLGTGAKFTLSILNPGGEQTGSHLPCGLSYELALEGKNYSLTFSDLINPFIFVPVSELGLTGTEQLKDMANDPKILPTLNRIREKIAVISKIVDNEIEARDKKPNIPKIAMIAPPMDYMTTNGERIKAEDVDILIKVVSMGKFHRTSPGSGMYNLAATSLVAGTLPHALARPGSDPRRRTLRIGHPEGIVEVNAEIGADGKIQNVGMERTARLIMRGELFVPEEESVLHD